MKKNVSVVLIGIGGYGNLYAKQLLRTKGITLAGVVDIHPEKSDHYEEIIEKQIPIFSSIEDFYKNARADLAIIATPIHFHAPQTCCALTHGSNVLCEKPISPTIQEAREIMKIRENTGHFVAIGFNWSFTPSVQQLKHDVMNGVFGKPLRMKTAVLWPRNKNYFTRASWAGKKQSEDGTFILDSVANNATSHFLHHMFYLLGREKDGSARIREVTAELYRANDIENFDTCAVKAVTSNDVEILFYATHAVKDLMEPTFLFEFEKATITYSKGQPVTARFKDGRMKTYPDPEKDHLQKLSTCIEATVSGRHDILCGPEAAYAHISCIHGMHQSVPEITPFPRSLIRKDEKTNTTWVEGLAETWIASYHQWHLPSEIGTDWAEKGRTVDFTKAVL